MIYVTNTPKDNIILLKCFGHLQNWRYTSHFKSISVIHGRETEHVF